jgi:Bacterial Ig-like domain (group 2)
MKRVVYLVTLTAFLAACSTPGPSNPDNTVSNTVVSLVVTGPANSKVLIDSPITFQATAKNADGNAVSGKQVSWSSSNPEIATVDAKGVVTARRIGPVNISATADGKIGTSNITSYGLEISGGTSVTAAGVRAGQPEALGFAFTWRIEDINGQKIETADQGKITGPAGFFNDSAVSFSANSSGLSYPDVPPIAGTYSAEIKINGINYTNKTQIDPTKKLGFASNIQVSSISTTSAQVSWSSVTDAKSYLVGICEQGSVGFGNVNSATVTFRTPLVKGSTYKICVNAWNYTNPPAAQVLQSTNGVDFIVP